MAFTNRLPNSQKARLNNSCLKKCRRRNRARVISIDVLLDAINSFTERIFDLGNSGGDTLTQEEFDKGVIDAFAQNYKDSQTVSDIAFLPILGLSDVGLETVGEELYASIGAINLTVYEENKEIINSYLGNSTKIEEDLGGIPSFTTLFKDISKGSEIGITKPQLVEYFSKKINDDGTDDLLLRFLFDLLDTNDDDKINNEDEEINSMFLRILVGGEPIEDLNWLWTGQASMIRSWGDTDLTYNKFKEMIDMRVNDINLGGFGNITDGISQTEIQDALNNLIFDFVAPDGDPSEEVKNNFFAVVGLDDLRFDETFKIIDLDDDGKITKNDLYKLVLLSILKGTEVLRELIATMLVDVLDENGDNEIGKDELTNKIKEIVNIIFTEYPAFLKEIEASDTVDMLTNVTNMMGKTFGLSEEEDLPFPIKYIIKVINDIFNILDKDNDNKISIEEIMTVDANTINDIIAILIDTERERATGFAFADSDGDGLVSKQEFTAYLSAIFASDLLDALISESLYYIISTGKASGDINLEDLATDPLAPSDIRFSLANQSNLAQKVGSIKEQLSKLIEESNTVFKSNDSLVNRPPLFSRNQFEQDVALIFRGIVLTLGDLVISVNSDDDSYVFDPPHLNWDAVNTKIKSIKDNDDKVNRILMESIDSNSDNNISSTEWDVYSKNAGALGDVLFGDTGNNLTSELVNEAAVDEILQRSFDEIDKNNDQEIDENELKEATQQQIANVFNDGLGGLVDINQK